MSAAFDTVNLHTLIDKLQKNSITKFIANNIKRSKQYTLLDEHKSKLKNTETGVPQRGVLSPRLFNIYTSNIAPLSISVELVTYADEITIMSSHQKTAIIAQQIQPYLDHLQSWITENNLTLN